MRKYLNLRTNIALGLSFAFIINSLEHIPAGQAQDFILPQPGTMVSLSPAYAPPMLKGIKVHPDNPFRFDFILDKCNSHLVNDQLKNESGKLIKYFLASLTIPEKDLWVNLSPYEKNRIVPESFGQTEMGRDLLAEDYMLKQITASLIYPEGETGKKFWKRIYEEAAKKFGTTDIPVNTFNKVWIVPEKAVVYENARAGTAYVVESKLKVMLEQDYLALEKNSATTQNDVNALGSQIVREIVIPELTKEVNEGQNFAQLRQVYNSLILAIWYKKKIKDSILEEVYADKNKVAGVSIDDPQEKQRIYERYLQAFKKGVFNYIKEEAVPISGLPSKEQGILPRKYFSGGIKWDMEKTETVVPMPEGFIPTKQIDLAQVAVSLNIDHAMLPASATESLSKYFSGSRSIRWSRHGIFYNVKVPPRIGKIPSTQPYASVTIPFDNTRFHFIKPVQPSDWDFDDHEIFWHGKFNDMQIDFIKQKWPFALKHFLILPQRLSRRPQILNEETIRLAINMVADQPFEGFRIGFNSLTSRASVNHLHLQGLQLPENTSPLEEAPLKIVSKTKNGEISMVEDYPARALFFSGDDPHLLAALAYRYVRFLQNSEITHAVVFTPKGVYVLPGKNNFITPSGETWAFYELMGFIYDAQLTDREIKEIISRVTLDETQFVSSYHEVFDIVSRGLLKYFPEQMSYRPLTRRVTHEDRNGHVTLSPEFTDLLGKVDETHTKIKVLSGLPVLAVWSPQRAGRQLVWDKLNEEDQCPLCALLKREYGHQLGVGNGFVVVPEEFPYFNKTATIVKADDQELDQQDPVIDRGLIESMAQLLYELGPFGFRVAYNYERAGKKNEHQFYKVFQKEMPIEKAPVTPFLAFPEISVKVVQEFPVKAIVLETKRLDVLVNELVRLEEFLKLFNLQFNIILSLKTDATIQAYIIPRSDKIPEAFFDKVFGITESAGVVLLEKEKDFNDPNLKEKILSAYQDITLSKGMLDRLLYVYKMHMALGREAIEHNFQYEIDTTGGYTYVCRIPQLGEVIKASKVGNSGNRPRDSRWKDLFTRGYLIARQYLGDLMATVQGVSINERGKFILSSQDPDYVIQKIVPDDTASVQIEMLLHKNPPDISGIIRIYEAIINYRVELAKRGVIDLDHERYLTNFRGNGAVGFDTSHLEDMFKINSRYDMEFQYHFKEHIEDMIKQYPFLSQSLSRFLEFSWKAEFDRRGVSVPKDPGERQRVPMPDWKSNLFLLSQEDREMAGNGDAAMVNRFSRGIRAVNKYLRDRKVVQLFETKLFEKPLFFRLKDGRVLPLVLTKRPSLMPKWQETNIGVNVFDRYNFGMKSKKIKEGLKIFPELTSLYNFSPLDEYSPPIGTLGQIGVRISFDKNSQPQLVIIFNQPSGGLTSRNMKMSDRRKYLRWIEFVHERIIDAARQAGIENIYAATYEYKKADKAKWGQFGFGRYAVSDINLNFSYNLPYKDKPERWQMFLTKNYPANSENPQMWVWKYVGGIKKENAGVNAQLAGNDLAMAGEVKGDDTMIGTFSNNQVKVPGGIDLTSDRTFSVQNNGQEIKFHLDPAQLAQLQNAPGFVPVIISILPMTDLREFLNIP